MKMYKSKDNPYGLTRKRQLVVEGVIEDIDRGKGMDLTKVVQKIYTVNGKESAKTVASGLWRNKDFREALVHGLKKRKILGANSKVERVLDEGLDAVSKRLEIVDRDEKGKPIYEYVKEEDYKTRLAYAQEVNKIAGVYAPEKKDTRRLNLNIDMTREELNERIKKLSEELNE